MLKTLFLCVWMCYHVLFWVWVSTGTRAQVNTGEIWSALDTNGLLDAKLQAILIVCNHIGNDRCTDCLK